MYTMEYSEEDVPSLAEMLDHFKRAKVLTPHEKLAAVAMVREVQKTMPPQAVCPLVRYGLITHGVGVYSFARKMSRPHPSSELSGVAISAAADLFGCWAELDRAYFSKQLCRSVHLHTASLAKSAAMRYAYLVDTCKF